MADKKEKVEKKRRIKGDAFWKLKGFEKKIRNWQEELSEWEEKKCEELGLYPDQINWVTGVILDPKSEVKDGKVVNGCIIDRLPHEVLREHKAKASDLKKIDKEMVDFRDKLCKQLNVWPDMIDLQSGIISDDDYEGVDLDEEIETEPVEEMEQE